MLVKSILVGFLLLTAASPLPELEAREVNIDCNETTCTVNKADLEWMIKRDQTLTTLVIRLANLAKACNFKDI